MGATVRFADLNPETTELDPSEIDQVISPATKLVAVTAASNILGTIPDVATIANIVHGVGALLFVDGVHLAAHASVDVTELGADFFACSPYKFLGPHCGALWGRPEIPEGCHPTSSSPPPTGFRKGSSSVHFLTNFWPVPPPPSISR